MMQYCSYQGFHGHASTVLYLRRVSYSQPSKLVSIHLHFVSKFSSSAFSVYIYCYLR